MLVQFHNNQESVAGSVIYTGAWSATDTLTNCNKVEHDKILMDIGKLTQERKNFENLPMSVEVTC